MAADNMGDQVSLPPGHRSFRPNSGEKQYGETSDNNDHKEVKLFSSITSPTSGDLPKENEQKDFNLLLQCLTTGENQPVVKASRKRCHSTMVEKQSADYSNPPLEVGFAEESTCGICKKVFSSVGFLRKHYQRMHETTALPPAGELTTKSILCPSCNMMIDKDSFNSHVCKYSPQNKHAYEVQSTKYVENTPAWKLACNDAQHFCTCQYCGMRMRNVLLDKHINQEHTKESGINRRRDPNVDRVSDSGSETLSGSDNDINHNNISCEICYAFVPKSGLEEHFREMHYNLIPGGNNYCRIAKMMANGSFYADQYRYGDNIYRNEKRKRLDRGPQVSHPQGYEPVGQYMLQRFLAEHNNAAK